MKRSAGFTMIEAIVIVGILAVLAGIVTPLVIKEISKSKSSRAMSDIEAIATAFNQYFMDTGYWPERWRGESTTTIDFLSYSCFFSNTQNLPGWDGPYLERSVTSGGRQIVARRVGNSYQGIVDAWGTPFKVHYGRKGSGEGGPGGAIAVVSAGPDLRFDTSRNQALLGQGQDDDVVRMITRKAY